MKLKQHRQDVKNLQKQADAYIWEVAGRLDRLVKMTEAYFNNHQSYFQHKDRVLRDAEVHKS